MSFLGYTCGVLGIWKIRRKENFISYLTIHYQRVSCSAASSHHQLLRITLVVWTEDWWDCSSVDVFCSTVEWNTFFIDFSK